MLTAGDTLAEYTVVRRLGSGGSADVFLAEGPGAAPVALKVLRPDGADVARSRERLRREFEIASLVHDPHVVAPLVLGESPALRGGTPVGRERSWLAMQYVDGGAATRLVPRAEEPDLPAILRVLVDVAAALDHCHRLGIVHRDVKPGNILVSGKDTGAAGHLTDFGVAQLLDPAATVLYDGQVDASLPYAAPELLRAHDLSPQTDEYAFAATAYELLAGRTPFPRSTPAAITHAQLHAASPAPDRIRWWLPSSLTSVFAKALAKRPEDRYRTCGEFAEILRRALRDVEPSPNRRRRW